MFGDIGALNERSMGTYAIWPFNNIPHRHRINRLYNKSDEIEKSKYLSYLFILTIICKSFGKNIDEINRGDEDDEDNEDDEYDKIIEAFMEDKDIDLDEGNKKTINAHNEIFEDTIIKYNKIFEGTLDSESKSKFRDIIRSAKIDDNPDPVNRVKVIESYIAHFHGSQYISIKSGDILVVTNKPFSDWWEGYIEKNGDSKAGLFPVKNVVSNTLSKFYTKLLTLEKLREQLLLIN